MSPSKPASAEAAASLRPWLETPLAWPAGVGPKRRARLEGLLGVEPRRRDALLTVPRLLEDPRPRPGHALVEGEVQAFCFRATAPPAALGRAGARLDGHVDDEPVALSWFRRPARARLEELASGAGVVLVGTLRRGSDGRWRCAHPRRPRASGPHALAAVHDGLDRASAAILQDVVAATVAGWPEREAPALRRAFAVLHGLERGDTAAARRRLAGLEWRAFRAELENARAQRQARTAALCPTGRLARALERRAAFTATPSQRAAHAAIRADLERAQAMRRLVSGDVGSGKTFVAALAIADVVESGHQALVVAPSESLARQHAQTLDGWLRPLGVEVALLTGAVGDRPRRPLLDGLATGTIDVVVGTQALLEEGVRCAALGLVVVDEQHRFGVRQRGRLTAKGRGVHMLTLTATPIPRTLVLMLDGSIDVSRLEPRPGTGGNVTTRAIGRARRAAVEARLVAALDAGERAFWVCATIAGENGAEARHAAFAARLGERAALLTGRQDGAERERVLAAFRRGERPLLVATSVVEVGIDVPDASIIVVENAERFGLAQLHQLRGRVGRAGQPASCVLLHGEPLQPGQYERLDRLRHSHDGLALAEADLALRGSGELLGLRQSGAAAFRFLDLARDAALLADTTAHLDADEDDPLWLFAPQPTVTGGLGAG